MAGETWHIGKSVSFAKKTPFVETTVQEAMGWVVLPKGTLAFGRGRKPLQEQTAPTYC